MSPAGARSTVNADLTPDAADERRMVVENEAYMEMLLRLLRTFGKRIAEGDTNDLARVKVIADALDEATAFGVAGLRAQGYSWADIARPLDITRQAAQQHFGGTS